MEQSIEKTMAAQAIGMEVIRYLEAKREPLPGAESRAAEVLEEICRVLDDARLSDETCFEKIEEIVRVLERNGIYTARHDW